MPTMTQIQVVREDNATAIYALDEQGRLWRGKTWMKENGNHVVKWERVEDAEPPRSPGMPGIVRP